MHHNTHSTGIKWNDSYTTTIPIPITDTDTDTDTGQPAQSPISSWTRGFAVAVARKCVCIDNMDSMDLDWIALGGRAAGAIKVECLIWIDDTCVNRIEVCTCVCKCGNDQWYDWNINIYGASCNVRQPQRFKRGPLLWDRDSWLVYPIVDVLVHSHAHCNIIDRKACPVCAPVHAIYIFLVSCRQDSKYYMDMDMDSPLHR